MFSVIQFNIQYQCQYGEQVHLIGSSKALGLWNIDQSIQLIWHEVNYKFKGNNWQVSIQTYDNILEYKYLIKSQNHQQWENGQNRILKITNSVEILHDKWNYQRIIVELKTQKIEQIFVNILNQNLPMNQQSRNIYQLETYIPLEIRRLIYKYSINDQIKEKLFQLIDYQQNTIQIQDSDEQISFKKLNNFLFIGKFPTSIDLIQQLRNLNINEILNLHSFNNLLDYDLAEFQTQNMMIDFNNLNQAVEEIKQQTLSLKKNKKQLKQKIIYVCCYENQEIIEKLIKIFEQSNKEYQ